MTSSTGQPRVVEKPASFCVFSTWLLLASFDARYFIVRPVAPLPPWRIPAKLAVLYMKDVPVFHPTADVQGPEQHPKDDAAKHLLAAASRKQGATATCIGQLCWATTTAAWEVQTGHWEKFLHQKEHATLEQIAQTGCGIAILGDFQHSARQSHSWPDLVLAIVLLQVEGWAGWPAEDPLNQHFYDSLPLQKMQVKYGFLWQQKDIICFVLYWFLNTS